MQAEEQAQADKRARIQKAKSTSRNACTAAEALPQKLEEKNALEKTLDSLQKLRDARETHAQRLKALAEKNDRALKSRLAMTAQDKAVAAAEAARSQSAAARLAADLKDGAPCPVCGAVHHPQPAVSAEAVPSEAEFEAMRAQLDALRTRISRRRARPPAQRLRRTSPAGRSSRQPTPAPIPRRTHRTSRSSSPPARRSARRCRK